MCRRSSAETNGDLSISCHLGMTAALGELILLLWQEQSIRVAGVCLAVPAVPTDFRLPGFRLQHKQQLIKHRRLREADVLRCQAWRGCNTLNRTTPVHFPVRVNHFEL